MYHCNNFDKVSFSTVGHVHINIFDSCLIRKLKWCKSKSDRNFSHYLQMMQMGKYVRSTGLIENFDTMDVTSPANQPLSKTKNQKYDDTSNDDKSTRDVKIIEKGSSENI